MTLLRAAKLAFWTAAVAILVVVAKALRGPATEAFGAAAAENDRPDTGTGQTSPRPAADGASEPVKRASPEERSTPRFEAVAAGGHTVVEVLSPATASSVAWVEPVDGGCPDGHPIKAKVASGIYHRPGGANYQRTRPDRCYRDEAAAEADGFRASKR